MGLSLLWPLPLRSTGSGRAGSAAMAHGPSHSAACGIFPDRGTNPCPLHQQADSQPLCHQGSPKELIFKITGSEYELDVSSSGSIACYLFVCLFLRYAGLSLLWPLPLRGAQAPDAQAQRPCLTGPAAPRHVGSSQTGARTRVPCIGRRTLNHCATREARRN